MFEELHITGEVKAYVGDLPASIIGIDSPWSIRVRWKITDLPGNSNGIWQIRFHIEHLGSQDELVLPKEEPLTVSAEIGSGSNWYSEELKLEGNNLPAGTYELATIIIYTNEQENSQPRIGYLEGSMIQIYDDR